jgi:hypothetical protein
VGRVDPPGRLADVFDPERTKTVRFIPDHRMPGLDALRDRLGEWLRMP